MSWKWLGRVLFGIAARWAFSGTDPISVFFDEYEIADM